jgi:hypothetical protein
MARAKKEKINRGVFIRYSFFWRCTGDRNRRLELWREFVEGYGGVRRPVGNTGQDCGKGGMASIHSFKNEIHRLTVPLFCSQVKPGMRPCMPEISHPKKPDESLI